MPSGKKISDTITRYNKLYIKSISPYYIPLCGTLISLHLKSKSLFFTENRQPSASECLIIMRNFVDKVMIQWMIIQSYARTIIHIVNNQ